MVYRQLARRLAFSALLALVLVPAVASGANRRVSISDYRWSEPDIHIDLGEHVTWYWIGPDTMHSVTGISANDLQLDSDPQTGQPNHDIGDNFTLDFNQPGVYQFHCKLHSTVKGTITVSAAPGDPSSEPDPVPKSNVDRRPPRLADVHLGSRTFGRRGTNMRFSLGEAAKLDADLYRYDTEGRRHFAGYASWRGHVGFNGVRFGRRSDHFKSRPGSYLAILEATDTAHNTGPPKRLRFRIRRR